ncbi:hypothetical protein TNCV_2395621 [Trichonephila clavipes]|nr:hypothetical protein TNCV_2395621 [Trichonephila clavipes]
METDLKRQRVSTPVSSSVVKSTTISTRFSASASRKHAIMVPAQIVLADPDIVPTVRAKLSRFKQAHFLNQDGDAAK